MKNSIKKGTIIIEVFFKTIKDYSFDNIYHKIQIIDLNALKNSVNKHNCKIFNAEEVNTMVLINIYV